MIWKIQSPIIIKRMRTSLRASIGRPLYSFDSLERADTPPFMLNSEMMKKKEKREDDWKIGEEGC